VRSPLHEANLSLGARFVDFGGWEMPLQYEGVLAEHRAVRETAGWFDVSHLGRFAWSGAGATEALRRLLCNDASLFAPGRTHYSMLLNDRGGAVDDLVVWRWEEEDYWVMPNAGNHRRVMEAFRTAAPEVGLTDLRPTTAMLAVQGPQAPTVLEAVLGASPARFRTLRVSRSGVQGAAGTGYTGERGGELVVASETAPELAEALTRAGALPCGLGARDLLRLEAGLALWGHELDDDTGPLEAGLEFAVAWDHEFTGRDALDRQRREGLGKQLVAFKMEGRRIPRQGYGLRGAGGAGGAVTSGNFSPSLGCGIGLGYLSPPTAEGIEVDLRGEWMPAEVVRLPFLTH
jgi:aminomethyltransferase